MCSENRISMVLLSVVNQRKLAEAFLTLSCAGRKLNRSARRNIPLKEQLPYHKAPKIVDFQSKFDNTCTDLKKQFFCSESLIDPSSNIFICWYLARGIICPWNIKKYALVAACQPYSLLPHAHLSLINLEF